MWKLLTQRLKVCFAIRLVCLMMKKKAKNLPQRHFKWLSKKQLVPLMTAMRLIILKLITPFPVLLDPAQTKQNSAKAKEAAQIAVLDSSKRKKYKKKPVKKTVGGRGAFAKPVSEASMVFHKRLKKGEHVKQQDGVSKQPHRGALKQQHEESTFLAPVADAPVSSGFGYRVHPISKKRTLHRGIDWAAKAGTTIRAAEAGVVVRAHYTPSFGHCVKIRHKNGLETTYAHLKKYHKGVCKGCKVLKGSVIGFVGSTGQSTGPHLHFEVKKDGKHVDPRVYLA